MLRLLPAVSSTACYGSSIASAASFERGFCRGNWLLSSITPMIHNLIAQSETGKTSLEGAVIVIVAVASTSS
jgi:hypothetical protein